MAKVKVKKQSTFIDMTAMSDVTVLLLTFFMLTSTFVKKEPIQVTTPSSVSEYKVPESNIMTILVDTHGKVFMSLDNPDDMVKALEKVGADHGKTFTPEQKISLRKQKSFGVPINLMAGFLDLSGEFQDKYLQNVTSEGVGIPIDSVKVNEDSRDEFQLWVYYAKQNAKDNQRDLQIAIKSDKGTDYPIVKRVMDDLRRMRENRYLLVTNLKTDSSSK